MISNIDKSFWSQNFLNTPLYWASRYLLMHCINFKFENSFCSRYYSPVCGGSILKVFIQIEIYRSCQCLRWTQSLIIRTWFILKKNDETRTTLFIAVSLCCPLCRPNKYEVYCRTIVLHCQNECRIKCLLLKIDKKLVTNNDQRYIWSI